MKIEKEERLPDEDRYDPSVGPAVRKTEDTTAESESEKGGREKEFLFIRLSTWPGELFSSCFGDFPANQYTIRDAAEKHFITSCIKLTPPPGYR